MDPIRLLRRQAAMVAAWWHRAVWEDAPRVHGWVRRLLRVYVRAWDNAVRSYRADLITMRANALTFRTLLALVPLLAVAFSLFQAFGGLEVSERALRREILDNLAPGSAAVAIETIESFVERISAGAIGGVSVVVLFITAVALLTNIEESFNALWGIGKVRPFLSRFVLYWTLVTVGPVLLALSFSLTATVRSRLVVGLDQWLPGEAGYLGVGLRLLPWFASCVAMTLLYLVVPNTRVKPEAALGGGVFAGTFWELGKSGFTYASLHLFKYSAIYGSFAALPVFLIWLQLAWTIALLGCKVSYGLQFVKALQEERVGVTAGPRLREFIGIRCMIEMTRAYQTGEPPQSPGIVAQTTAVPLAIEKQVLNRLVDRGLLLPVPDDERTPRRGRTGEGYVPARDVNGITIREILAAFREEGSTPDELEVEDPASDYVKKLLEREGETARSVTDLSLAEAVERISASQGPRPAKPAAS
jgi:membrane protein